MRSVVYWNWLNMYQQYSVLQDALAVDGERGRGRHHPQREQRQGLAQQNGDSKTRGQWLCRPASKRAREMDLRLDKTLRENNLNRSAPSINKFIEENPYLMRHFVRSIDLQVFAASNRITFSFSGEKFPNEEEQKKILWFVGGR